MVRADIVIAGRYRLVDTLGQGGMGRVWLARDEVLHRDVAVKEVVMPDGMSDAERDEHRQRTLREARAAARIVHAGVVRIYDVLSIDDQPWIVMEYVPSRSLHQVLDESGPLEPVEVARIGLAVLSALRAAHSAGVLHRDVKPSNVLLGPDGRVVLTDFGLAIFEGGEGALTVPGLVLGSPQYVAPERARTGASSPEADLWSLGATLYAAVEGRSPYARSSSMATLTALATQPPDPANRAGPLRPVIAGLLRKNPRARLGPNRVDDMLRAIRAGQAVPKGRRLGIPLQSTAPVSAVPASAPAADVSTVPVGPRPGRGRLALTAGLAAAAAVATAVVVAILIAPSGSHRAATGPPAAPSLAPSPSPSTAALLSCGTATAMPPAPTGLDPNALLSGWRWYADPDGYRVAVPAGWTYAKQGDVECFREPGGSRLLRISPWTLDNTDPVNAWRHMEAKGTPPGYRDLGIKPVDYYYTAADWEFTYTAAGGRTMHALDRGFITGSGRGYGLLWVTLDFDWAANQANCDVIAASFRTTS